MSSKPNRTLRLAALLPLAAMGAAIAALEHAFAQAVASPGGPPAIWGVRGDPVNVLTYWVDWLAMSGNGFVLAWACGGDRLSARLDGPAAGRWWVWGGAAGAVALCVAWAGWHAARRSEPEVWAFLCFVAGPVLAVGFGSIWHGVRRLRGIGAPTMLAAGYAGLNALAQSRYERVGGGEPDERTVAHGSLLLAVAVALRLALWGWELRAQSRGGEAGPRRGAGNPAGGDQAP